MVRGRMEVVGEVIERIFVEEGIRKVRLDEYFKRVLDRAGYGGMDIKRTPMGTQITVYVERPGIIIGKDGRRIRQITEEVSNLKGVENPQIDVQPVDKPELNAQLMASQLANMIERGWHFRRVGRIMLSRIMEAGALGCEITISGKLTGPRARVEKMVDGYMKHCGGYVDEIVDEGFAIALKKAGVIGVKVRIVRPDAKIPEMLIRMLKEKTEEEKEEAAETAESVESAETAESAESAESAEKAEEQAAETVEVGEEKAESAEDETEEASEGVEAEK